jgi:hypothetical protein
MLMSINYKNELERILANPTPAQALVIEVDQKARQKQKAIITNLEAWGPYDFYITVGANPSVTSHQDFQVYLKKLLKAVSNDLMAKTVHPDTNPLSIKACTILGYVTVEYSYQFYAHITFRLPSVLKLYGLDELADVFTASANGITVQGSLIPVFDPRDCRASLVIDIGGSEALAYHNLELISDSRRVNQLNGIYSMFGRKLERML